MFKWRVKTGNICLRWVFWASYFYLKNIRETILSNHTGTTLGWRILSLSIKQCAIYFWMCTVPDIEECSLLIVWPRLYITSSHKNENVKCKARLILMFSLQSKLFWNHKEKFPVYFNSKFFQKSTCLNVEVEITDGNWPYCKKGSVHLFFFLF